MDGDCERRVPRRYKPADLSARQRMILTTAAHRSPRSVNANAAQRLGRSGGYDCDEGPVLRDKHAGLIHWNRYNADYPCAGTCWLDRAPTRNYGTFPNTSTVLSVADSATLSATGDDAFWRVLCSRVSCYRRQSEGYLQSVGYWIQPAVACMLFAVNNDLRFGSGDAEL